ncbi:MAG: glycosyltransferase [Candidatus Lokiarchaeota archaeon]|nr:glycosyltransferase [Candidatus Lokiarchaeota archaeon]
MATINRENAWILTFEYAGIIKVGGLGEVPANQARYLANQYNVSVFIPSHGQLERLQKKAEIQRLPFVCVGELDPRAFGIADTESSYAIAYYKLKQGNVNLVLLSGENEFTNKYLDDNLVYNPDTFAVKLCLYCIGMRYVLDFYAQEDRTKLPHIVHLHDYHAIIPFIGMKQELAKNGLDVASLITVHLLMGVTFDLNFYKACGIDETPLRILTDNGFTTMSFNEIFSLFQQRDVSGNLIPPKVETIGAHVCDIVTTVSKSYLESHLLPSLGLERFRFKTDFVWNGCDWDYSNIFEYVNYYFGGEMRSMLGLTEERAISRDIIKRYLLTRKMSNLSNDLTINSPIINQVLEEISLSNPYINTGNILPFTDSGPLVLMSGRITPQKGFDIALDAVPEVISAIPNAKFLFLLMPTEHSINDIKNYATSALKYPNNIRIIFGSSEQLLYIAYLAADVYAALSRWEPFGIIALEAMASKLPVIATKVGGFQESILDIRQNPANGTGILIEKDDPSQFATSLIDFLRLCEVSKFGPEKELESFQTINLISDAIMKSQVLINKKYYETIRENCFKRINSQFRWSSVTAKLITLYQKAKKLHFSQM